MDNLPTTSGISSPSALRNNYFGAGNLHVNNAFANYNTYGSNAEKIDPLFQLVFSRPNGVPQESKLATYMNHQGSAGSSSLSNAQGLGKSLAGLSIDGGPGKKVLGSEYIPSANHNSSSPSNFLSSYSALAGSPVQQSSYNSTVTGSPVAPMYGRDGSPSLVAPAPQRITPRTSPPLDCISPSVGQPEKPVATYQENVGGTTYFYPATPTGATSSSPSLVAETVASPLVMPNFHVYPGTPSHLSKPEVSSPTRGAPAQPANLASSNSSFYTLDELRLETMHKHALVLAQPDPALYPELPGELDHYHELCPLEPLPPSHKPPTQAQLITYPTSTYKATHLKNGSRFCLRRVHGFRLASVKCMALVDMWKRLQHPNIVQLREVFTTKAFNDNSILFVYDYHPGSETLMSKYFSAPEQLNGYVDAFSADPNAPRPYSHQKNALLRQHASLLPEAVIWSYVIQLTSALRVIHAAGLACRSLEPSKVLITGGNGNGKLASPRIRLSFCGIADVISFDATASNPLAMMQVYQQEDLSALGRLVLALACKSLLGVQRENLQTSMELVTRSYSNDLRNLIVYLLSNQQRGRSVTDLMPMIGARFYTQLDSVQLRCDLMENEVAKEVENGRLCRLLVKLGTINERPELNMDPTWSETGDRYMLKLFRDYVFHQVTEEGRPWLDMAHVVNCLNKLDAGTQDKVYLMSRDEQSVLVVSYAELKHCLEQSFTDILNVATSLKA